MPDEKSKPKARGKPGPKSQITIWEKPDSLLLIQGWKRNGLTDVQIAKNIGVGIRTLYEWKNKSPQILHALKRGKEHANFMVENALYKKALEGNTTAMIYWLKNNYREKYYEMAPRVDGTGDKMSAAKIDKAVAEAEIAKAQAEIVKQSSTPTENITIVDEWSDGNED